MFLEINIQKHFSLSNNEKKYTTPTIEELNKDKYSLKKKEEESTPNPYYRDFLDVNKGMYKPKIAWVKSRSKNGFLLDPYDENGNKINSNNNQDKYDVGYIAELNAPGIYSCDLNTSDNIVAVTQNIDIHYTNTEFNVKDEYINNLIILYLILYLRKKLHF